MNHRLRLCQGFTLMTMLVVLPLIAVFGLLASRLFVSSLDMVHISQDSQTAGASFDHMVHQLRCDVWNATAINVAPGNMVNLQQAGDLGQITWQMNDGQEIRRTVQAQQRWQQWKKVGAGLALESHGSSLSVRFIDGPVKQQDQIELVSQMILAERRGQ